MPPKVRKSAAARERSLDKLSQPHITTFAVYNKLFVKITKAPVKSSGLPKNVCCQPGSCEAACLRAASEAKPVKTANPQSAQTHVKFCPVQGSRPWLI